MLINKISKGNRFITRSGRVTKPHPAIGKCPHRMLKAHRAWIKDEYLEEANYNMCQYNAMLANALNTKNWTVADQESALTYLFGNVDELPLYSD